MARILVLSPYEPPSDGIAKHTGHLVDAWDSAGHSVFVMAPGRQRELEGTGRIGLRSKVARVLRRVPRRRTWHEIVEFKPDLVFVQFAIAALNESLWSVRRLCKKCAAAHIPVVVAYHEPAREYDLVGIATRLIYKSMVRVTEVPIAFSTAGRESLIDAGLFKEVVEVPHGTTGVANITDEDVRRVRALYHIQKPVVLSIGFTDSDKGTDVLLDAVGSIAADRNNDVQFLIAGSPRNRRGVFRLRERRDVKCQQRLEDKAKVIANVDIEFSGFVAEEDVAALLFVAEVVALPYRRITQSGIANLALSSRSVVVCSDLPGLRSDLGDVAKYVKVGDSRAMAKQIVSLLGDDNASAREHMRERSGERAAANNYSKVAEMILSACLPQ